MKLLFICEKIDKHLQYRIDQLADHNIKVECLLWHSATLFKNGAEEEIKFENELGFLENSGTLQTFVKSRKYKKLCDSLAQYDSVNIYNTVTICAPYLDHIRKLSKSYFVTVEDAPIEHNRATKKLFNHAHCLLFKSQSQLESFEKEFGYDEKTLLAREGNHLFMTIDALEPQKVEQFKHYLNISDDKHLVYCGLGADSAIQRRFIDDILKLPYELLKQTTFIFDPEASTMIDKEMLIEYLEDKEFDFLLPDTLLSDVQKAMLFEISHSTIILPGSDDYHTLDPSLYLKNHVYRYESNQRDPKYQKLDVFIDSYDNFENSLTFNTDSHHLADELTQKNREIYTTLYHPQICLENYLKILEIL